MLSEFAVFLFWLLLFVLFGHLLDDRDVLGDVVLPVVQLHLFAEKISRILQPAAIDLEGSFVGHC